MIALILLLVLETSGCPPDDLLNSSIQSYSRGEYSQAIAQLSKQVLTTPDNPLTHFWLGKAYLKAAKWDEAVRELEIATRTEPGTGRYHLWLGRALGRKAEHSTFFIAMRQARAVLKEFEAAVKLSPSDPDSRFDLLEFYLEAPPIVGGGKDKANRQVLEIDQISKRLGYSARSRILQKEQKWELARQVLTQATEEFPRDPDAHLDLAEYLFQRQDYQHAAEAAAKSLGLASGRRALLILSASEVRLGRKLDEAANTLREMAGGPLLDDDPSFEEVHFWLGQALLALGRDSNARDEFEKALSYDPDYRQAKEALNHIRQNL